MKNLDLQFQDDMQRALYIFVEAMKEKSPHDFQQFTGYPLDEIIELFSTAFTAHRFIDHEVLT